MPTVPEDFWSLLADRYELQRELGRGGMATVSLARDLRHGRSVAVKVLREEVSTEVAAERFLQEIRIAARLQHPHIVPLFDSGQAAGRLYYVAPFIDGQTLRERLTREHQLAIDEAIRIAVEVADAIGYAHGLGVVHRDIKPENILFSAGHALVADFGIARAFDRVGAERITGTGSAVGTPAYMSPEQSDGETNLRSDIYSLGCVLYEMLVGHPPFSGTTGREILARHAVDPVPSIRPARQAVSEDLDAVVAKALAKQPTDRFATAAEFIAALAGATKNHVTTPTVVNVSQDAPPSNSVAVLPFVDRSEQQDLQYFCDGMTEEVIDALTKVHSVRVVSRTSVFSLKGRAEDVRKIGRKLNVGNVLEGSVRTAGERLRIAVTLTDVANGYQRWAERYDRSMTDVFAVQDEIAQTIVSTLRVTMSGDHGTLVEQETSNVEAYRLYLKGRHFWHRRFEGGLQQAIQCFHDALTHDPEYARAYSGLADCFLALGTYEFLPPNQAFPRALAACEKALKYDETVAEAHASLGLATMYYRHDWESAERSFRRAIDLDTDYASAHQFYSILLAATGRLDAAIVEARRASELDPLSPIFSACIGWMLYFARRYDEAIESCRTTLEVTPGFAIARGILGQAYLEQGKFDDAIRELIETSKTFPPALGALGHAYGRAGRPAEAEEMREALKRRVPQGYVSPYGFAILYAGVDDRDHAFEWLLRSYDERSIYVVLANVNPMFDRLRADTRFEELRRKLHLEPAQA